MVNFLATSTFSELVTLLSDPEMLIMIGFLIFLWLFSLVLGGQQKQLTSGRFVNSSDKLNANKKAFTQIENVKKGKCQPCTLWSGTPNYWLPKKFKGLSSYFQIMLGSPPTLWIPHAERGLLVIGAPGSGKTFSVIDRSIESALQQNIPVMIYDKKGDQMKLHCSLAARYGYDINVFAPGEPYSGVINVLDFMASPQDATMAGEIGQVIIKNSPGSKNAKGDNFFQQNGAMLAKGLLQLAKSSIYPDLAMVYALARLPSFIKRLDYAVYRDDEKRLDPWIASTFSTFLASKDAEKTVAGIKATAESTYSAFIQKDLLQAFIGKSTIPLEQGSKQLIVFKLDDKRRTILTPLLAACIHLCIVSNLAEKRKIPFVYSLDEFPSIYLDRIVNYVNEYRSNGGVPIIGIQSLTQLAEAYGSDMGRSIAAALSTHFLFNPGDMKTAEDYSKRYGETEIKIKSRSRGRSMGNHPSRSTNVSESLQKKPLLSADEIMRFPQGTCVLNSPAYGNNRESLFPYKLRIPVPSGDIKRAKESEDLWDSRIEQALINRMEKIKLKRSIGSESSDEDWITQQLNLRLEESLKLLPLPDEEQEDLGVGSSGGNNIIYDLRKKNKFILRKEESKN